MLRIVRSTLSLVGPGRRSIVPATNGSQRVGGCNPQLAYSRTVTCSSKIEPKVAVISAVPKLNRKLRRISKENNEFQFKSV